MALPVEKDRYDLITVQQCRSADGWTPIRIASESKPGRWYSVLCNPWHSIDEFICQCESYMFRGWCRHQDEAAKELCGWRELIDGKETELQQSDEQQLNKICPQCGGPTKWVMEILDAKNAE